MGNRSHIAQMLGSKRLVVNDHRCFGEAHWTVTVIGRLWTAPLAEVPVTMTV